MQRQVLLLGVIYTIITELSLANIFDRVVAANDEIINSSWITAKE
jgi:hypothetical protein